MLLIDSSFSTSLIMSVQSRVETQVFEIVLCLGSNGGDEQLVYGTELT